jgi:hypothetical protein
MGAAPSPAALAAAASKTADEARGVLLRLEELGLWPSGGCERAAAEGAARGAAPHRLPVPARLRAAVEDAMMGGGGRGRAFEGLSWASPEGGEGEGGGGDAVAGAVRRAGGLAAAARAALATLAALYFEHAAAAACAAAARTAGGAEEDAAAACRLAEAMRADVAALRAALAESEASPLCAKMLAEAGKP